MKKFKKLLVLGFATILTCGITACNKGKTSSEITSGGEHLHTFESGWTFDSTEHWHKATCEHKAETNAKEAHKIDNWTIIEDATETTEGSKKGVCSVCGYEVTNKIPVHNHSFAEEWSNDATHHWHESLCEHNEAVVKEEHSFTELKDKYVAPTLTTAGTKVEQCSECKYEKSEALSMLRYERIDENGKISPTGMYLRFGSYPQSEETDKSKVQDLISMVGKKPTESDPQGFTSYRYFAGNGTSESQAISDYMWYKDIDEDQNGLMDYRCVYYSKYRPYLTYLDNSATSSFQDENYYKEDAFYFFKYEPIKWKILNENNGQAMILAELILDSQDYQFTTKPKKIGAEVVYLAYSNNYRESMIKQWLNNTFFHTAFSAFQKEIVEPHIVDNSEASTGYRTNQYACDDTKENVFLLSYNEVTNTSYGFTSNSDRVKKGTEYAKCQGLYVDIKTQTSYWWLRSPYNNREDQVRRVDNNGDVSGQDYVNLTKNGVVPALYVSLN